MPPKRKATSKAAENADSPAKKAKPTETKPKAKAKKSADSKGKSADSKGKFSLSKLMKEGDWKRALQDEMQREYFTTLESTLDKDYQNKETIFPPQDLIFCAFNLTPLKEVKVVILGQDPYHDTHQAHGLCFSVPGGVDIPPSLRNMYKELEEDVSGFKNPGHGCLTLWAVNGVFLLNSTLTVQAHKPNSHKSYGWQKFTDEVIRVISRECDFVVFLLWGNFAHKKEKLIDVNKHVVLKDAHPSPLSFGKFKGCKCFSRANEALKKAGLQPVDWKL